MTTRDSKLGDYRENKKRRPINSPARPGVLGRVVWRKHPPLAESVQGWEGQLDSVSSEDSWFSLETETARFRREVEDREDFGDD